jgi:hypothetical protein
MMIIKLIYEHKTGYKLIYELNMRRFEHLEDSSINSSNVSGKFKDNLIFWFIRLCCQRHCRR